MGVLASCLIAFLSTVGIIVALRTIAPRLGLVDNPDERKRHEGSVPLVGGIAIYLGFVSSMTALTPVFEGLPWLMAGGLLLVGVGAWDDGCRISAEWRFATQIVAALLAIYGADVRLYDLGNLSLGGGVLPLGVLSVPFTVFTMVGTINAINFSDGTDGLAGTLTVLTLLALIVMASGAGRYDLFHISICLASAVTAFLLSNLPGAQRRRSRVFLGDAGSTLLGYLLAYLLIASSQGNNRVFAPIIAVWLVALPIGDSIAVATRRLASGRSPFHSDRTHVHHLALSAGLSQRQTLFLLSAMSIVYIIIGLVGWLFHVSDLALLGLVLSFFLHYFLWTDHARTVGRFLGRRVCRRSGNDRRQIATSNTMRECRQGNRRLCADRSQDGARCGQRVVELERQRCVDQRAASGSSSSATSRSRG